VERLGGCKQASGRARLGPLAAVLLALIAGTAAAEPYTPADDSEVLERLPRSLSGSDAAQARGLRARLAQTPRDLPLAIQVAREQIARARREADPRYMGYAEAALLPWYEDPEIPAEVLLLRATIRQNRHDFAGALADLEELLRREPENLQAWLIRSSIETVRGDYERAERSCAPLRRSRPRLVFATCTANAASLRGRAEPSLRALGAALEAEPSAAADVRVWSTTLLAEIAERLGQDEVARTHYRSALAVDAEDSYLLTAYSDFLLRTGAAGEVVTLLEGKQTIDGLLLRLALAYRDRGAAGDRGAAEQATRATAELQSRFAAARQRGSAVHQREEAMLALYLLGDADEAVALAVQNWQQQREAIDLGVLLAAARATRAEAAERTARAWVSQNGFEDARLAGLLAE
jgi:Tfp pilus assembly protein PilF